MSALIAKDYHPQELELYLMQVLKFGRESLMIVRLIFGLWDVWYTNLCVFVDLLKMKAWNKYTKR